MTLALAEEIYKDHERIISRLKHLTDQTTVDVATVRPVLAVIGAHHLAEEDTLYEALKSFALASVGEAQMYHLVLDDLTHTIEIGDRSEEPLHYQLCLLQHLLEHHFLMEETQMLEILVANFSLQRQQELGHQYRERYRQNIIALRPASKIRRLVSVELEFPKV